MRMKRLMRCVECPLRGNKKVWGEIGKKNGLLFLGEAPGRNEEEQGKVFCGKAGKKLDEILKKAEEDRKNVTIINTLLCRPPSNRDPTEEELKCCRKRVLHTITKMDPKVIILLGRIAFRSLFKREPLKRDRLKRLRWKKFRVLYVYHPAYFIYRDMPEEFEREWKAIRWAIDEENWDI